MQEDSEPGDVDEEDALNVEPASAELPHVDSTLRSYTDSTHTRTSVRDSLRRVRFPRSSSSTSGSSITESDIRARVPDAPTSGPRTSRGPVTPPRDSSPDSTRLSLPRRLLDFLRRLFRRNN